VHQPQATSFQIEPSSETTDLLTLEGVQHPTRVPEKLHVCVCFFFLSFVKAFIYYFN
jgi:hypothetical protein